MPSWDMPFIPGDPANRPLAGYSQQRDQSQLQRELARQQSQQQMAMLQAQMQAQQSRDAQQFAFQQQQSAMELAQRQREMQGNLGFQRQQLAQQGDLTRAQIEASLQPLNFAKEKWNTLFPWVQGQMGQFGSGGGGSGGWGDYGVPGSAARPAINDAPIWSQGQIDQQVNAARAGNDIKTAGLQRQNQNQLAARGFGSRSPLAAALNNQLAMSNLATNTDAERQTRWDAAQGNAAHVLDAQKARTVRDLGYLSEETKRGTAARQQQSSLLAALLGMLG